jgi:hypothetical protein
VDRTQHLDLITGAIRGNHGRFGKPMARACSTRTSQSRMFDRRWPAHSNLCFPPLPEEICCPRPICCSTSTKVEATCSPAYEVNTKHPSGWLHSLSS